MKRSVSSHTDVTSFAKIINLTPNTKLNNVGSFSQQDVVCMENDATSYIPDPPLLHRLNAVVAFRK